MKSQLTITIGRKNTINKQHMKMQVLRLTLSQSAESMSPHLYDPAIP
jgi:hypothetical protein